MANPAEVQATLLQSIERAKQAGFWGEEAFQAKQTLVSAIQLTLIDGGGIDREVFDQMKAIHLDVGYTVGEFIRTRGIEASWSPDHSKLIFDPNVYTLADIVRRNGWQREFYDWVQAKKQAELAQAK